MKPIKIMQELKESNYSNIKENDPVLDKKIKVYDINAWLDKNMNDGSLTMIAGTKEYQAFHFDQGAAIIITKEGDGCIVDYEAIGSSFNATSDTIKLDLCEKDGDDGKGHRTISLMPTARIKVTIDELLQSPSKSMKVRDFFKKWDYNDRCARNFEDIKHYIEEAGD